VHLHSREKRLLPSSCLSTWVNVAPNGWVSVILYIGNCYENLPTTSKTG